MRKRAQIKIVIVQDKIFMNDYHTVMDDNLINTIVVEGYHYKDISDALLERPCWVDKWPQDLSDKEKERWLRNTIFGIGDEVLYNFLKLRKQPAYFLLVYSNKDMIIPVLKKVMNNFYRPKLIESGRDIII